MRIPRLLSRFNPSRRASVNAGVFATLVIFGSGAHAQTSTIMLMVGFFAGGATDVLARTPAEKLSPLLGSTVVVRNKASAGGQIAAQVLKGAAPDGTTFFLSHDPTENYKLDLQAAPYRGSAPIMVDMLGNQICY